MPVNVSYVSVVPPPEGALNERGETAYHNNKKTNKRVCMYTHVYMYTKKNCEVMEKYRQAKVDIHVHVCTCILYKRKKICYLCPLCSK